MMKTEKEIRKMYDEWRELKGQLLDCGDRVSLIAAKQATSYMSVLEFVLDIEKS